MAQRTHTFMYNMHIKKVTTHWFSVVASSLTCVWTVNCEECTHQMQCQRCLLGCVDADNDAICNITHEQIVTVDVPGLPRWWHMNKQEYDYMKLLCWHMFHLSTIMFHFLVYDMWCPICRQVDQQRASMESVPESVTGVFKKMLEQVQAREQSLISDKLVDIGLWPVMSAETIEVGIHLVVEVHCEQSVTFMPWCLHSWYYCSDCCVISHVLGTAIILQETTDAQALTDIVCYDCL